MRTIQIDPAIKTITELNLTKDLNHTLSEVSEIIGCDIIEFIHLDYGFVMLVDEEARHKIGQTGFTFIGSEMIVAGKAIIAGYNAGKFETLHENIESFEMITEWISSSDIPRPTFDIIDLK